MSYYCCGGKNRIQRDNNWSEGEEAPSPSLLLHLSFSMTPPRPPSGRQRPLRYYSDSERTEGGSGSWDTLEWNKLDVSFLLSPTITQNITWIACFYRFFSKKFIFCGINCSKFLKKFSFWIWLSRSRQLQVQVQHPSRIWVACSNPRGSSLRYVYWNPTLVLFLSEFGPFFVVQGYGVVLINTDEAGTLLVTNFRILFLVWPLCPFLCCLHVFLKPLVIVIYFFGFIFVKSEGTRKVIPLGTITLATIEKFNKTVSCYIPCGLDWDVSLILTWGLIL